jgi:hydroxymethylpyrimidine kinase/phosphomethylpyrimidine kinase
MSPRNASPSTRPRVLAIAGLDPSAGAGLLLDSRVIHALEAHACGVATALVPQNTRRVLFSDAVSAQVLADQLDAIMEDITIDAIKIGLVPSASSARVIASRLKHLEGVPIVYDTVLASSSGTSLLKADEIHRAVGCLAPFCELLTPNLHEARVLCGFELETLSHIEQAARSICERFGARQVLVKGGHAQGIDQSHATDYLWNGSSLIVFNAPRLPMDQAQDEVRGTGCALSSAIASLLAQGLELNEAIAQAKAHLSRWIEGAAPVGKGRRVMSRLDHAIP